MPAWATFTFVQVDVQNPCSSGTTSCNVAVTALGAGHAVVGFVEFTETTTDISSVSGGGTYSIGTKVNDNTIGRSINWFYNVNTSSGATTITVNLTQSAPSSYRIGLEEWSVSTGNTIAFDVSGGTDQASCTTCAGVALALGGANDAILQAAGNSAGGVNSISAPYTFESVMTQFAIAHSLNTVSGTAPNWTLGASSRLVVAAVALKEVTGAAPIKKRVEAVTE